MKEIITIKDSFVGMLASFLPIILTSFYFENEQIINLNYYDIVRFTPFLFAIVHSIVFMFLRSLNIKINSIYVGSLFAIIILNLSVSSLYILAFCFAEQPI